MWVWVWVCLLSGGKGIYGCVPVGICNGCADLARCVCKCTSVRSASSCVFVVLERRRLMHT